MSKLAKLKSLVEQLEKLEAVDEMINEAKAELEAENSNNRDFMKDEGFINFVEALTGNSIDDLRASCNCPDCSTELEETEDESSTPNKLEDLPNEVQEAIKVLEQYGKETNTTIKLLMIKE